MKRIITWFIAITAFFGLWLLPVSASPKHVVDHYGLLEASAVQELEDKAIEISNRYEVDLYIRIENDRQGYSRLSEYAEYLYKSEDMGYGPEKNGYLLTIDMNEREYLTTAYGSKAHRAFTDYGKDQVEAGVEYELRQGDWYEAMHRFLNDSEYMLSQEAQGTPVDIPTISEEELAAQKEQTRANFRGITAVLSPLTSLLVCLRLRAKNKTAGIKTTAVNYIPEDGLRLAIREDSFMYRTETRIPINTGNSSGSGGGHSHGGTTINSGGFSHGSGGHF